MDSAAEHDMEKGVATEVHATADSSTDRNGKHSSLDHEDDGPRPLTSVGKLGYWGIKMEDIWGVEARGITRVMTNEKNVPRPLHDYFHMFSLWFSINLQAVNIIIGLLGPLVYGLGWVDCICIVIFANALASCGIAYIATFGAESGNRTMVCFLIYHCLLQANLDCTLADHWLLFHGLLAFESYSCLQHCPASRLWHHWMYHYWPDDHSCQWRGLEFGSWMRHRRAMHWFNRYIWH